MKTSNGYCCYRRSFRILAWGALIGIFVCGFFAGLFMRDTQTKIEARSECAIEEEVLLGRIKTNIDNMSEVAISDHVNNMMVYKRLVDVGCKANQKKYTELKKAEQKYIDVLRGEVMPVVEHIENPCIAVERLLEKDLRAPESRNSMDHVKNAVVYSKLVKSGCKEKLDVYRKKIQYELQIALGVAGWQNPECGWVDDMTQIFINTESVAQAKTYISRCFPGWKERFSDEDPRYEELYELQEFIYTHDTGEK